MTILLSIICRWITKIMVKYLYISIFVVAFQLIACDPGASKDFSIKTTNQKKVSLFDKEAEVYLTRLGFKLVELEEPDYPHRKLYKKYPLQREGGNVMQTVQLTYGDGLIPKVSVGEWVATDLSSSSENVFMILKYIADKHGLLLEEDREAATR